MIQKFSIVSIWRRRWGTAECLHCYCRAHLISYL